MKYNTRDNHGRFSSHISHAEFIDKSSHLAQYRDLLRNHENRIRKLEGMETKMNEVIDLQRQNNIISDFNKEQIYEKIAYAISKRIFPDGKCEQWRFNVIESTLREYLEEHGNK